MLNNLNFQRLYNLTSSVLPFLCVYLVIGKNTEYVVCVQAFNQLKPPSFQPMRACMWTAADQQSAFSLRLRRGLPPFMQCLKVDPAPVSNLWCDAGSGHDYAFLPEAHWSCLLYLQLCLGGTPLVHPRPDINHASQQRTFCNSAQQVPTAWQLQLCTCVTHAIHAELRQHTALHRSLHLAASRAQATLALCNQQMRCRLLALDVEGVKDVLDPVWNLVILDSPIGRE